MSVRGNLSRQIKSRNPWTVLAPGYQGHPGTPWNSEESETEGRICPHHCHASPDCVPHMNKVFSIARQTYGRSPMDDLNDLDVNTTIWVIFVSCHSSSCSPSWTKLYGKFCDLPRINPWSLWDNYYERLRGWSRIRQKLPNWPRLTGSSLCRFANFKTYVFSDSVRCLGAISDETVEAWESRIKWFLETRYLKDLDRVDGEPMKFEWTIFPGFTTLGILDEIQKMMTESKCEPEHFKGRIIFMSVYNDIDLDKTRKQRKLYCECSLRIAEYARSFTQGHWSFLGPGAEKDWYGTHAHKLDREWEMTAEGMMLNFAESGHPEFRATSALERELRSKDKG